MTVDFIKQSSLTTDEDFGTGYSGLKKKNSLIESSIIRWSRLFLVPYPAIHNLVIGQQTAFRPELFFIL